MSGKEDGAALLLAPGAGADRNQPSLVAIESALAPLVVERLDFPYRRAGRKSPDRPEVLMAAVRDAAAALAARAGVPASRLVLGGRSMGGRMCSLAVADAEAPLPALGLVLISYPLHPPGKPDRLRTEHLGRLEVPCLFVSGTRDAFGAPAELEAATALIQAPVTHVWIDGATHGLKGHDDEVAATVRDWVLALISPGGRHQGSR